MRIIDRIKAHLAPKAPEPAPLPVPKRIEIDPRYHAEIKRAAELTARAQADADEAARARKQRALDKFWGLVRVRVPIIDGEYVFAIDQAGKPYLQEVVK